MKEHGQGPVVETISAKGHVDRPRRPLEEERPRTSQATARRRAHEHPFIARVLHEACTERSAFAFRARASRARRARDSVLDFEPTWDLAAREQPSDARRWLVSAGEHEREGLVRRAIRLRRAMRLHLVVIAREAAEPPRVRVHRALGVLARR
jgi:hypothetical protein